MDKPGGRRARPSWPREQGRAGGWSLGRVTSTRGGETGRGEVVRQPEPGALPCPPWEGTLALRPRGGHPSGSGCRHVFCVDTGQPRPASGSSWSASWASRRLCCGLRSGGMLCALSLTHCAPCAVQGLSSSPRSLVDMGRGRGGSSAGTAGCGRRPSTALHTHKFLARASVACPPGTAALQGSPGAPCCVPSTLLTWLGACRCFWRQGRASVTDDRSSACLQHREQRAWRHWCGQHRGSSVPRPPREQRARDGTGPAKVGLATGSGDTHWARPWSPRAGQSAPLGRAQWHLALRVGCPSE